LISTAGSILFAAIHELADRASLWTTKQDTAIALTAKRDQQQAENGVRVQDISQCSSNQKI